MPRSNQLKREAIKAEENHLVSLSNDSNTSPSIKRKLSQEISSDTSFEQQFETFLKLTFPYKHKYCAQSIWSHDGTYASISNSHNRRFTHLIVKLVRTICNNIGKHALQIIDSMCTQMKQSMSCDEDVSESLKKKIVESLQECLQKENEGRQSNASRSNREAVVRACLYNFYDGIVKKEVIRKLGVVR